jgi:hypothetical protein
MQVASFSKEYNMHSAVSNFNTTLLTPDGAFAVPVQVTVSFSRVPGYPATRDEPECDSEIDVHWAGLVEPVKLGTVTLPKWTNVAPLLANKDYDELVENIDKECRNGSSFIGPS